MIEVKSSFEGLKAPNDEEAVEIAAAEKFSGSDKITNIPQKQGGNEDQKDINVTNVQESTVLEFSKTGTSADTMTQEDATRSCDVRPKLPESMGTPVASLPKIFTFEFVQNPHQSSSSATFSAKAKTFMSPLRQSFTFDDSPGTSPSVSPSRFEKTGLLIQKALGSPVRLQKEMQVVNTSIMEEVPTGAAETPKKKITSKKRVPTPRSSKKKAELAVLIQTTEEPNPVTQHSAATEAKSDMGDEKKDEPEKSGLAPSKVYSVAMMPPNPNVNFTEAAQTPPPATTVTGKRNRGWGNGAAAVVQAYDDTPASTKRGISGKRKRVRVCAEEETEKEDDDGIFQDARMEISNCNVSPSQQRNYVSRGMDPQEWFETSDEDDGYDGKEERTAVGGGGDAGGSGWMFGLVKGIGRKIGMFG
ncbi:hypothetical protein HDU83_006871 [Entophlyctis luteolus]|nr:hypothetical protein HDU83_006871 [Entophlyctis luteolus]